MIEPAPQNLLATVKRFIDDMRLSFSDGAPPIATRSPAFATNFSS